MARPGAEHYGSSRDGEDFPPGTDWRDPEVFEDAAGLPERGRRSLVHQVSLDVSSGSRSEAESWPPSDRYGWGPYQWAAKDLQHRVWAGSLESMDEAASRGDREGFVQSLDALEEADRAFTEGLVSGKGFVSKEGYEGPGEFRPASAASDYTGSGNGALAYLSLVRETLEGLDPSAGDMDPVIHRAGLHLLEAAEGDAFRVAHGAWTDWELEFDHRVEQTAEGLDMRVRALDYLVRPSELSPGVHGFR